MNALGEPLRRLRGLTHRRACEEEMAEEMQLHLAHRIEENLAAGMPPDEARYAAQRRFGPIEQFKEKVRDQRVGRGCEEFFQDLRHGVRQLARAPGSAALAILILALGIGAGTALFNVARALLLHPLPFADADQIICPEFRQPGSERFVTLNLADHAALSRLAGVADSMASSWSMATLVTAAGADYVKVVQMTESAFDFLGAKPQLGRLLGPGDVSPEGAVAPVAVISDRLWERIFHRDPRVLGQTIKLNGAALRIVGVADGRFSWKTIDGLWIPLAPTDVRTRWINSNVRLEPGFSRADFQAELAALFERIVRESPGRFPPGGLVVTCPSFAELNFTRSELGSSLHLLFSAVGFLLLIACANVACLQLASGTRRRREFAVRLALGAGRARLVRQLLTECMVLAIAAGTVGVLLAFGLTRLVAVLAPPMLFPREGALDLGGTVTMQAPVLGFSLVVSMLTGIVFGLGPALQCTRPALRVVLKEGGSEPAGGRGPERLHRILVIGQVALTVILLVGACLAIRSFVALRAIDPGLLPDRTLVFTFPLSPARYSTLEQRNDFTRDLVERVRALPGVHLTAAGLLPGAEGGMEFTLPGFPSTPPRSIAINLVDAAYRATLGIPLLAGRDLTEAEVVQGARVALINAAAARLWPDGASPLGRTLELSGLGGNAVQPAFRASGQVTIVGIVGDTRQASLRGAAEPNLFLPYPLIGLPRRALVVRPEGDPRRALEAIRAEVHALDPQQPVVQAPGPDQLIGEQTLQPRFNMALLAGLAGFGLMLTGAGLFSLLSYRAARCRSEFALRLALGATPADLQRRLLGEGARLVALGLLLGLAASFALTPWVRSANFLVSPLDPVALAAVTAALALATGLAVFWPISRAARLDLTLALRHE